MMLGSAVRRALDTLSGRLAMVFAVLVLPPTVMSFQFAWDSYVEHSSRARLQVRQFATLTATYESKFFDDTRKILQDLGREAGLRAGDFACRDLLARTVERTPEFESLAFFDAAGGRICGSDATDDFPAGRDWLDRVRYYRSFAISDYTMAPNATHPVIVAAQAIYGADGLFEGVLAVSIRLYWLSAFIREASLPADSVFFLVDSNGNVLADRAVVLAQDRPRPARATAGGGAALGSLAGLVGETAAAEVLGRGLTDFEASGPDGVRRVFSSVVLPHGDVTVLFGMPAVTAIGWLEQDLMQTVLGLAAIWCAGLGAAWFGTRYLVTRWTRRLSLTAQSYGRGNYADRTDFARAPRELRELGATLALMARRIELREEELRCSLEQKNMLLREIHHRVKNNLQIVSSLLNIRGGSLTSSADRAALDEIKAQMRALALAHRHLYETEDVGRVALGTFMTELCRRTVAGLSAPSRPIALEIDIPDVTMPTDRAIPLALLVTEAITNALKHAFPGGRAGRILVTFTRTGPDAGTLTVADDGVGLPDGAARIGDGEASPRGRGGLGLRLLEALARQVDGELEIRRDRGTAVSVHLRSTGGEGSRPAGGPDDAPAGVARDPDRAELQPAPP